MRTQATGQDRSEVIVIADGLGQLEVSTEWVTRAIPQRAFRLRLTPSGSSRAVREFLVTLNDVGRLELEEQRIAAATAGERYDGAGIA